MLGKKFMYKRSVMIAIAVVALMTLTAGVAAAASVKAKKIEIDGGIGLVTLDLGSTVKTKFRTDKESGAIKSVEIKTDGELIFGQLGAMLGCEEKGKRSEGACLLASDALSGAGIASSHKSTAKLSNIVYQDANVVVGTLKGSLKADLTVSSLTGEVLTGKANLRIKSSTAPTTYTCIHGIDPTSQLPVPATIQDCQDAKGKKELGLVVLTPLGPIYIDPVTQLPDLDSKAGPILVPVDLHVLDTGTFNVKSASTKIKGKIAVSVDTAPPGTQQGVISITKAEATFAVEKPEKPEKPGKPKKGNDDDDDEEEEDEDDD